MPSAAAHQMPERPERPVQPERSEPTGRLERRGRLAAPFAVAAAMIAMSVAPLLALSASRDGGRSRAMIFAPWVGDAPSRTLRAGYTPLRTGLWPTIVVIAPAEARRPETAWPDGVLLTVDLDGLLGCLGAGREMVL